MMRFFHRSFHKEKKMAASSDLEEDDEFCYAIDDDQGPSLSSLNDFSFLVEAELSFVHGVDFSHDRKAVVREVKEEIVADPTPKLAAALRTWLPLPHVDTQPHVWEFKHTARWPEDEFATPWWSSCPESSRNAPSGSWRLICSRRST